MKHCKSFLFIIIIWEHGFPRLYGREKGRFFHENNSFVTFERKKDKIYLFFYMKELTIRNIFDINVMMGKEIAFSSRIEHKKKQRKGAGGR